MATLERQEGDYTYWSDGATRYAKGNSLGKAPGSLAKRHPKSAPALDKLPVSTLRKLQSNGGKASYKRKRDLIAEAHAVVLREMHPDYQTEEEGLRTLAEAAFIQASDENGGGPAVKARAQFFDEYAQRKQEDVKQQQLQQINITISPGVEAGQQRLTQVLLDEIVSVDDVDEG